MIHIVLHLLFIGTLSVCGLMLILWLIHLPLKNAAIVDPGWAGGLALLAILDAILGGGYRPRVLLIAAMATLWGLRLALFLLFTRIVGQPEEGRYVQLRRDWGRFIELKFLVFYEFQAILCVLLSVPFLLASINPQPQLSILEFLAAALWLVAWIGETAADAQLQSFKSNPANRGGICKIGLWKYSRHPNYFFEWLIWVAYALFALASPYGFLSVFAPLLMLYFLFRVTGIPATEAQALRSRGDAYRQYQKTTSAFVPWFPRSE
jgi:steroid 5-alpha reductase family enzyme